MSLELNRVYKMDCLEFMKSLPDKSVDLLLTDPPYGINADKSAEDFAHRKRGRSARTVGKDYGKTEYNWDSAIPAEEYFAEMFRVSKNQIIWGGNYFGLPASNCWIVWDKMIPDGWAAADCELAWTSFKITSRMFRYRWCGYMQSNMQQKEKRYHPTQKPVKLFEFCIKKFTKPGDIVLDIYAGSGTTAIAALNTDRKYILVEREQLYIDAINKRIGSVAKSVMDFLK